MALQRNSLPVGSKPSSVQCEAPFHHVPAALLDCLGTFACFRRGKGLGVVTLSDFVPLGPQDFVVSISRLQRLATRPDCPYCMFLLGLVVCFKVVL